MYHTVHTRIIIGSAIKRLRHDSSVRESMFGHEVADNNSSSRDLTLTSALSFSESEWAVISTCRSETASLRGSLARDMSFPTNATEPMTIARKNTTHRMSVFSLDSQLEASVRSNCSSNSANSSVAHLVLGLPTIRLMFDLLSLSKCSNTREPGASSYWSAPAGMRTVNS